MSSIPTKPVVQNQEWINGETKLNQTNLTSGVNQNITNLKTAVDGLIDVLNGELKQEYYYDGRFFDLDDTGEYLTIAGSPGIALSFVFPNCFTVRDASGRVLFFTRAQNIEDTDVQYYCICGLDEGVYYPANCYCVSVTRVLGVKPLYNLKIFFSRLEDSYFFRNIIKYTYINDITGLSSQEIQNIIDNKTYFVNETGTIYIVVYCDSSPTDICFMGWSGGSLLVHRYLYAGDEWSYEENFSYSLAPEITSADDGKILRADYSLGRPVWSSNLGTTITGTLNTTNFTENGAGYYKLYYTNDQMILTVASRVTSKVAMPAANGDTYDFVDFTIPQALGNKLYPIHSASLADTGTLRNMAGAFNTGCPGYWLRIRKVDSTHIRVQVVTTVDISNPIAIGDNMQIADSTTFIL